MPLIGIIAQKKDIIEIRRKLNNVEIIEIKEENIKNFRNIKFDEIIFIKDIKIKEETYKYMREIISKVKYLILNGDIKINSLGEIKAKNPIKLITYGFNSKSTITISSVKDDKIIIYIQRNIEKENKEIIETQEKELELTEKNSKKIYNNLVVFIIKELHNL